MAAVDALELIGVKPLFKRRDGLVQQIAAPASMQPHIIALGFNPFNIHCGNADEFGAMGYPKFMRISAVGFRYGVGRASVGLLCASRARNGAAQPLARHRF